MTNAKEALEWYEMKEREKAAEIEKAISFLKANGYSVIKKKKSTVKLSPCLCGRGRGLIYLSSTIISNGSKILGKYRSYICECGFEGGLGKTEQEARILWNESIEKAKER